MRFGTCWLTQANQVIAPDGSEVRVLLGLAGGGFAHFRLAPGAVSIAVRHRTVEEIWYVISGRGQIWRKTMTDEEITDLEPELCVTIPVGTHFQFRSVGLEPLDVIAVTMPPWPGADEAFQSSGPWQPTLAAGPGLGRPDSI
jgi:mannose-6-phosphate isomerase-like protein (cupin superfamily)